MTSIISSIFTSASAQIATRVEAMRSAEASLAELARNFGPASSCDDDHTIETYDTRIPRSSVPLKSDSGKRCLIDTVSKDDDHLIMHGVKASRRGGTNSSSSSGAPLVILHGYMNGALYFYRNLLGLAQHFGTVHSLDMLGWGLSSRPTFDLPEEGCSVESAESFFVESLEAWRETNGIDKMTLAGHSMGGYLSVAYAERYPQRVDKLILLSPVGVPDVDPENDPLSNKDIPFRYKLLFGTFRYFWSRGTTPGSFARSLPESKSRTMVDRYVEGRLPSITCPDEQRYLGDYLYHSALLPGSGEFCLNRILKPGAYARKPTVDRIPHLKVDKISFVYGQNDWMDKKGGIEVQRRCDELRDAGEVNVPDVEVHGVRDAGHMLMLENWRETNSAVILGAGGRVPEGEPVPGRFSNGNHGSFFKGSRFSQRAEEAAEEQERRREAEARERLAAEAKERPPPVVVGA